MLFIVILMKAQYLVMVVMKIYLLVIIVIKRMVVLFKMMVEEDMYVILNIRVRCL